MTISRICTLAPLKGRNTKVCLWGEVPYQVWCRSVQEFSIPEVLKIGVFHWQGESESPLQQFCTSVQTVIWIRIEVKRLFWNLNHTRINCHFRYQSNILGILDKTRSSIILWPWQQEAQLSQRDRCMVRSFWPKVEDGNCETIFCGHLQPRWHYRPAKLSNSLKNTQNKGYNAVQGHSRSPRSVPIESSNATSFIVINSNGHPISYRFEVIADCCINFRAPFGEHRVNVYHSS